MSDPPLEICDNCGQPALRKLVSAAGFRLKGTGWYVTDFRDKGKKPAGEKSKTNDGRDAQPEKKKEETASSKSDASAVSTSSKTGTG